MKKFSKLKLFGAAASSGSKNLFGTTEALNTTVKRAISQGIRSNMGQLTDVYDRIVRLTDKDKEKKPEEVPKKEAKRLPENFAEQVLDCELEIEKENVNIEVVKKLINLYQQAMEYYESINSDRHLIFLSKTQALLSKTNVVQAMNNTTETKKTIVNQVQDDKEKKLEEFFKKTKENKIHFDEYAGSILKSHEAGLSSIYMLISNSLSTQRAMMKRKLERRKKAHFRRLNADQVSIEKEPENRRKKSTGAKDLEDEIMAQNRKNSSSAQISKQLILSALSGISTEEKSPDSDGIKQNGICFNEVKDRTSKELEKEDEIETTRINTDSIHHQDEDHKANIKKDEVNDLRNQHEQSKDSATGFSGEVPQANVEEEEKFHPEEQAGQRTSIEPEDSQKHQGRAKLNNSFDESGLGQASHEENLTEPQAHQKRNTVSSKKRNTCTLTNLSEKLLQEQNDADKKVHRRSLGDMPELDKISQKHKQLIMEQSKKQLLDKLEINHNTQIQELVKRLEEQKIQEIEATQKKYQETRENIETEMQDTSALLKRKLLEKTNKDEKEAISKLEEEWRQKIAEEQHSLIEKQKQATLFKLSRLNF